MLCASCKHDNRHDRKFCVHCGATLEAVCPSCGARTDPAGRFCGECGKLLAPSPATPPDPRAYTPRHLAEKILSSHSALEGERKQVTVLFADLKGSMDLSETIDPEDWHRIMERFFKILTDGVHRFEGTVNQYTGDGIMALFGAPIAHEDHATRACYSALALQEDLRRYATELRLERALNFSVRIGLNSGEVVVGKIGDDLRMDYTALGHTASLAARMEQIAEPGKAYVSEDTAKLVDGLIALRDLGAMKVKGAKNPIRVYELEGVGDLKTKLEVSRVRGFSRFVGREDEMAILETALGQAIKGNGQVVGVVAEAGTGKSRLCYEFLERCRARDVTLYEAHGVTYGKSVPLLPFLQFFRAYFGITDHDSARASRDKIAGRMLLLDATLGDAVPPMFDFLGVPDPERPAPTMSAEARQRLLFDVMRRLAHARSTREPAVFLFEDLHWFDKVSESFLEHLVEIASNTRTLLLLNFRPEYHAGWMQRSYYHQLPLLPLSPEATAALLVDWLGADPSLGQLTELIQQRTGGNPFFIEEIVRSLIETGVLAGGRGGYRLTTPAGRVGLPVTVQSVLAARIDRLGDREKQVLQSASVIGRTFSEPILRRIVKFPEESLAAALNALINGEFLYEGALYPEAEYAFKHPLTQEVAYRSQLADRRARIHAAVARTIEEIDAAKLQERAPLLAYHWEQAGETLEAVKWHRLAAQWSGLNDQTEAIQHWNRVAELLDTLPDTPGNLAERASVRTQIVNHMARTGDPEGRGDGLIREAAELATRSGDARTLGRVLYAQGILRHWAGSTVEALEFLGEASRRAEESNDFALRVAVRYGLGFARLLSGQLPGAVASLEEGRRLAEKDVGLGGELVGANPDMLFSVIRGMALVWAGDPRVAGIEFDRILEAARVPAQSLFLYAGNFLHVFRYEILGDVTPTMRHARAAVDYGEKTGSEIARVIAYTSLGLADVLNEHWDDALESLNLALIVARDRRLRAWEGLTLATMSRAHLGLGDLERAKAVADEAIATSRSLGTRMWEGMGLFALIQVLRRADGAGDDIQAALGEAMAWVEACGAKSWAPFFHLERAELARRSCEHAVRQRELTEAHRLFLEIGASPRAAEVAKQLGA